MRCSLLLFFLSTAVVVSSPAKRLCLYDVFSRTQRNAPFSEPTTVENLLHELISSDSANFLQASPNELEDRKNWLLRLFQIGMAENKRTLLKKQETLRYFRETADVFSPRTNIVQFANDVVPQLETVARRIRELGYEPMAVLTSTYKMAFTRNYLEKSKDEQLEMIRVTIRPAVLPSTTTTTSTTTTPEPIFEDESSEEEDEEIDEEDGGPFNIEAGSIDEAPAAIIYTQAPRKVAQKAVPHTEAKMRLNTEPLCLNLERCNSQGECQNQIDGFYMTDEEICACFEGFTGPTCSDRVILTESTEHLFSSSMEKTIFLLFFLQFVTFFA